MRSAQECAAWVTSQRSHCALRQARWHRRSLVGADSLRFSRAGLTDRRGLGGGRLRRGRSGARGEQAKRYDGQEKNGCFHMSVVRPESVSCAYGNSFEAVKSFSARRSLCHLSYGYARTCHGASQSYRRRAKAGWRRQKRPDYRENGIPSAADRSAARFRLR